MIPTHLAELPPEVYSHILTHVPWEERQRTTFSLIRAIPRSPVPLHHLFECIRLKSAERVVQLYRRLRERQDEPRWAKEFSLETWTVDADVVVNLVALLSQLSSIALFIGPNFAPEHVKELLERPREALRYLSLRFRPYVQRATYYQFLKGAYFDTALETLSRWPAVSLPILSIVQDPLDKEIARRHYFAQPLVFFRLDPINKLVAPFIYSSPRSLPGLRILDLSTCDIRLVDVEALAARFQQLMHLIVDGCSITRGNGQEGQWENVGKTCALATVKATKERERKLKVWLDAHAMRNSADAEPAENIPQEAVATRRPRPGRRGLATATISFRDGATRTTTPAVRANTSATVPKIRIVASSPTLCSLSMTTSTLQKEKHEAIRAQFERGWEEGVAQLTAIRSRLYQSWKNGVKMMRTAGDQGTEEGFEGLEEIDGEGAFYGRGESGNVWSVPVLCLAGGHPGSVEHVDGCGHAAASSVWPDHI